MKTIAVVAAITAASSAFGTTTLWLGPDTSGPAQNWSKSGGFIGTVGSTGATGSVPFGGILYVSKPSAGVVEHYSGGTLVGSTPVPGFLEDIAYDYAGGMWSMSAAGQIHERSKAALADAIQAADGAPCPAEELPERNWMKGFAAGLRASSIEEALEIFQAEAEARELARQAGSP